MIAGKLSAILGPACVTGCSAAVVSLFELAGLSVNAAGQDQTFSIPAPVLTPIVGYGTIFTGIIALIGMVGLFYGMKYSLNSALSDLKDIKSDSKAIKDNMSHLTTKVEVHQEKIRSNAERIQDIQDQLYQASMGINFGKTAANRPTPRLIQRENDDAG